MNVVLKTAALSFAILSTERTIAEDRTEDQKLIVETLIRESEFGSATAVHGTTAIIGARGESDSGSAYLFDTGTWKQLFKLTAEDAARDDNFGASVAIHGTTALVGAPLDDDNGSASGSAYLFDTTTGRQLFKLNPSDGSSSDRFGTSVALYGTTAIVGANLESSAGSTSGAAYVFDTATGQQRFKLTASDAGSGDQFGYAVALSGTTALVGAWRADLSAGAVYVFEITTGQQLRKLAAEDAGPGHRFGDALALAGSTAVIGSSYDDTQGSRSGSVYIFDTDAGQQLRKITPADGSADSYFGQPVAVTGHHAIIGAVGDTGDGQHFGSAYVYNILTGTQAFKLLPSDPLAGGLFGNSVAANENTVIVGAPGDGDGNSDIGAIYLYDLQLPCNPADLAAPANILDLADLTSFVAGFTEMDLRVDLTGDGLIDLADVTAFIAAFIAGCP